MRGNRILLIISLVINSCHQKEVNSCFYMLDDLYKSDSSRVYISYKEDDFFEVSDTSILKSFGGTYRFNNKYELIFYRFFIDSNKVYYSENFNKSGKPLNFHGVPLLSVDLLNRKYEDSILVIGSLFSLFKRYEDLEIISNQGDTIRPSLLYKGNLYSNSKEFYVKLPKHKDLSHLIIYFSGVAINTCNSVPTFFKDTVSFNLAEEK